MDLKLWYECRSAWQSANIYPLDQLTTRETRMRYFFFFRVEFCVYHPRLHWRWKAIPAVVLCRYVLCVSVQRVCVENGRSEYDRTGGLYTRTNPMETRWNECLSGIQPPSNPASIVPGYGMIQMYPVSDSISFLFRHNPRSFFVIRHILHSTNFTTGNANSPLEGWLLPANVSPRRSGNCQPPVFECHRVAWQLPILIKLHCPRSVRDLCRTCHFMLLCFVYGVLRRFARCRLYFLISTNVFKRYRRTRVTESHAAEWSGWSSVVRTCTTECARRLLT